MWELLTVSVVDVHHPRVSSCRLSSPRVNTIKMAVTRDSWPQHLNRNTVCCGAEIYKMSALVPLFSIIFGFGFAFDFSLILPLKNPGKIR